MSDKTFLQNSPTGSLMIIARFFVIHVKDICITSRRSVYDTDLTQLWGNLPRERIYGETENNIPHY